MKVGLFDPRSLSRDGRRMTIDFISADDVTDIIAIPIETAEQARRIRLAMEAQKNEVSCPFLPVDGDLVAVRGAFVFNPDSRTEGMIGVRKDGVKKGEIVPTPFRLGFDVEESQLPQAGSVIAKGVMQDGALVVLHLAMMPVGDALVKQPQSARRVDS